MVRVEVPVGLDGATEAMWVASGVVGPKEMPRRWGLLAPEVQ